MADTTEISSVRVLVGSTRLLLSGEVILRLFSFGLADDEEGGGA
jgi:hypothetical protein